MQMTAEEIVRHYQQAKDKRNDLRLLADLNGTDTGSIKAILIDAGLMQPDRRTEKTAQDMKPVDEMSRKELGEEIQRRIRAGENDKAIAEAVGCTAETVRNHRKKLLACASKQASGSVKPERIEKKTGIPLSARVGAIIRAVPERAPDSVKLKSFELCWALLESEPI